ncbi:CoA ester lyase [Vibrio mimicus]
MMKQHQIWGAHLFVPANNAGFLEKLPLLPVRNVIIDLEYATRLPYKLEARHLCKAAIGYIREVRPDLNICVRTNLYRSGKLFLDDITAVAAAKPGAIRIPSVNTPDEITHADSLLSEIEEAQRLPIGAIKLHPMIETPQGLYSAYEIAAGSPRVEALCLGGEDWAYNCGLERSRAGKELEHVKFELVSAAARAQVTAVDSVYNWLDDIDGLETECRNSFSIGMRARATINPRQLKTINEIYRSSHHMLDWANGLLSSLNEISFYGQRHFISNGIIVDELAVAQARAVVTNAQ